VIEPVEWKRDAALKFGATHVYPDLAAAMAGIAEATYGLMAHKVVVTVGELKGEDIDNYMHLTAKGGTCVLTAIGSLLDTQVTLNLAMLTLMQKNLQAPSSAAATRTTTSPSCCRCTRQESSTSMT
jgi:S-(hydroxymethyl)glutathione dehydrogenase/alcohol dehydrogenase